MSARTAVLAGLLSLFASSALAGEIREVTETEAGSYEEALRESLLLMKAGDTKTWMSKWCTPIRCSNEAQREELEAYMLKQATQSSKNCLHGETDTVQIKSVKGDPAADDKLSVTLVCTHTKYPPPAVLEKVEGKWYVTSIPW